MPASPFFSLLIADPLCRVACSRSAAPVGANFLPLAYSHSTGDVLVDPSSPVTDIDARIDAAALGYVRTFGLFGRSASLGAVLAYVWLNASGEVAEEQREVSRAGFGDPRLRFSMNLLGGACAHAQGICEQCSISGSTLRVYHSVGDAVPPRPGSTTDSPCAACGTVNYMLCCEPPRDGGFLHYWAQAGAAKYKGQKSRPVPTGQNWNPCTCFARGGYSTLV